MWTALVR